LLPATPAVNDAYYFGYDYQTRKVSVNVGTVGTGTYEIDWEYWNGAWTDITPTDNTNGFTTAGENDITYTLPSDWVKTTINSTEKYYIRARLDAITSITQPLGTQAYGTGSITIDKSYVTLEGVGDSSKIYLSDTSVDVVRVGDGTNSFSNIVISNLQIDGNSTTKKGLYFISNISQSKIESNYIHSFGANTSVVYLSASSNNLIKDNYISTVSSSSSGMVLIGASYDNRIIANHAVSVIGGGGITLSNGPQRNLIEGNILSGNRQGIWLNAANYNIITGNVIEGSTNNGIWLYYSDNVTVTSNIIKDSGQAATDTYRDIYLSNTATYNKISDNYISATASNKTKYGIYES
ncbi:MAG: right-handed parallel beta-helix repeat-containing protein, partial [Candidatus Pacebacteria bacterium]|nr:right-handed parallel beta-helix repeat-containing protein [Candidatus Paceibacterota bacterium]